MKYIALLVFLVFLGTTPAYAATPTLTDYWNGKAVFKFTNKFTQETTQWPAGFDAGVHVEVVGNVWYLFTRKIDWGNKPSYCQNVNETMHMEVRKSMDEGKIWSDPLDIITNTPNTPWECAATDGDAFYNAAENRWHYLFQCLDRRSAWSGCHATRVGSDPYGAFTPSPNNPTIDSGEIWSKICNSPAKDCSSLSQNTPVGKVVDEGTFDIFDYQSGYYFVDLHGYDGINGYRGIAKTPDFQSWEAVAPDAVLDLKDARAFSTPWDQNGPIGFGAGRILKDQGYYYLISEAADKNLGCATGQQWVLGMFRSQDLTSTTWQQLPKGNPFFSTSDFPDSDPNPLPCNPAYSGLFVSQTGRTYFHTSRSSYSPSYSGIYLYTLVPKLDGDIVVNAKVDIFDYNILVSDFGKSGDLVSDIDANGKVDIFDYNILVGNFNKSL